MSRATAAELCALAVDFDAYRAVEPRLEHATWITAGPPRAGARAEVVARIPFSVPVIRHVVGPPVGAATLERYDPPRGLAYTFISSRAFGRLEATLADRDDGCQVTVVGWVAPRARAGRMALAPLGPVLNVLASRAVARGIDRAERAAGGSVQPSSA